MPVLRHAKKKLRQDKKRTAQNRKIKDSFKSLVKDAKAGKTAESVSLAFRAIDKAAKQNILPKNRAARMKSSLAKVLSDKAPATATPVKKSAAKKAPAKKAAATKKTSKKATKKSSK